MLRLAFFLAAAWLTPLAATTLLPSAVSAQPYYDADRSYSPARHVYRTPLEVWLSGEGWDEDYSSSHVCVGGFRWMTRNVDQGNSSAAQAAVPVRC